MAAKLYRFVKEHKEYKVKTIDCYLYIWEYIGDSPSLYDCSYIPDES